MNDRRFRGEITLQMKASSVEQYSDTLSISIGDVRPIYSAPEYIFVATLPVSGLQCLRMRGWVTTVHWGTRETKEKKKIKRETSVRGNCA